MPKTEEKTKSPTGAFLVAIILIACLILAFYGGPWGIVISAIIALVTMNFVWMIRKE